MRWLWSKPSPFEIEAAAVAREEEASRFFMAWLDALDVTDPIPEDRVWPKPPIVTEQRAPTAPMPIVPWRKRMEE